MGRRRSVAGSSMLITGASQGIGQALTEAALKRGARVLAVARSEELLNELAAKHANAPLHTLKCDITSAEDRQRMADAVDRHFSGALDILVNNAGIGATGHFMDADPQRLRKIMEVNFFGTTETTRVLLSNLRRGKNPVIVNISSIAGKRGIPARSEYSASKFAVHGFSEAIRAELDKDGIDVLLVNPGLTQTNFSKNMLEQKALVQMDHMRGMTSEEVAEHTLRSIERGTHEKTLTFKGKLMVFVARFLPFIADRVGARTVRNLFKDEMEARRSARSH